MVNSDFLNGLTVKEAIPVMKKWLEEKGIGHEKVNYKLRTGSFPASGIGEPIPLVHCDKCGWVPSAGGAAPLLLPEVSSYESPPTTGESPPATMTDWVNTTCPLLRRPRPAGDRHHAPVGWVFLVLPAVHGPPQ